MLELKFTNRPYSTVALDKPRTTLGSDPGNDVVLPESGIAEFQVEFFRQDDQVLVVDLIGRSCMKNGIPIEGSEAIQMGDLLNLESVEIEVIDPLLATEKFDASDLRQSDRVAEPADADISGVLAAANDGSSTWRLKGLNESVAGLRFPLGGKVIVGRDPSCDLVLKTPQVSRRHIEIEVLNSQLFVRDLGSTNGCKVNDEPVTTAMVRPGDKLSIDQIDFLVEGPDDDEEATVARHFPAAVEVLTGPYLLIRSGDRAGQKIPLVKSRYTIGRNSSNDIMLEDQSVSSRHALLINTGSGWKIEDAESTNGTSINGEAVMGGQLRHSDRIRLGSVKLAFIVPADLAEEAGTPAPAAGFDPDATVKTMALKPPRDLKKLYWAGGAILVLLVVTTLSMVSDRSEMPRLEPINEPLSASPLWQRQLPDGRSYPTAPLLADVNGDQFLDVAVADGAGHLLVLDGEEGKKIFDLPFAGRVVASPVATDLTGDGIKDLVVASFEGRIYAVNGKAQLLWKTGANSGYGTIQSSPIVVDLDANGSPEILVATSVKGVVALNGITGQELWNTAGLGVIGSLRTPLVADITDDGVDDLVVTAGNGDVWALSLNGQTPAQQWQRELPAGDLSAPTVAVGPDGPLVLVAAESGGIYALFGKSGLISWRSADSTPHLVTPLVVDLAEQQLLAVSTSGQVAALSVKNGETNWQREVGGRVVAAGALFDLSNDQIPDLLVTDQSGRLLAFDSVDGALLLSTEIQAGTGILVSPVVGDINNDQLAEVVVSDQSGGITAVTLNRTLPRGSAPWAQSLHRRSTDQTLLSTASR